jgi:PAS domain S-box-containing protein
MAIAAVALLGLLAGLAAVAWRQRPLAVASLWAWAWALFVAQRLCLDLAPRGALFLSGALLAGALFPALQLAGARAYAGAAAWPRLVPAALALGGGAAVAVHVDAATAHAGAAVLHTALLGAAAWQSRRAATGGVAELPERALPGIFVALALLGAVEGMALVSQAGAALPAAVWLVAAPGAALCQLMAAAGRAQRADVRHEADRADIERRLAESEERTQRLGELSSDFSYAVRVRPDRSWRLLWVMGAFRRLTGYTREDVEGGWLRLLVPEDRDAARARYLAAIAGAEGEHEYRIRTKSGEVRWLHERLRSALDAETGDVIVYGAAHDISERRRADEERERLQARLHESQRLESMGAMARGVAHDFNQLLTPILGQASAGLAEVDERSPLRDRLERIRQAAEYAAALVQQMLTYAGQGALTVERVDLSRLVEQMLPLLRSAVTSKVRLEADLAPALPLLRADPMQIRQVVLNLVSNGAEALSGSGSVWVRTGAIDADDRLLRRAVLATPHGPGRFVALEVEDDGPGMDETTREHLFDPFFSTKREGRGLGLPTVLGIVRRHEGAILVDAELGKGSRFRILLPLREQAHDAAPPRSGSAAAISGRRVLLVDDDEAVAEVASEFLTRAGFQVRVATSGKEGLETFLAARDAFDAVVLDWSMPGVDGAALLAEIRRLAPSLAVVVASGLDAGSLREGPAAPGLRLVRKPFAPEALVGALRDALGEAASPAPPPPPSHLSQ